MRGRWRMILGAAVLAFAASGAPAGGQTEKTAVCYGQPICTEFGDQCTSTSCKPAIGVTCCRLACVVPS